jgi:hypothetical protein
MEVLVPGPGARATLKTPAAEKDARKSDMRPHAAPRGSRRRARTTVAAAPSAAASASARLSSAAATHLSGFFVRAVEPRESSYLHYTSLASPGTHTEYHVAVSDVLAGGAASWIVSRRFSAFLLLRDELQRGLSLAGAGAAPHCALCGALREELAALARELPRKRLWGSSSTSVVRQRAAKFLAFLRALLGLATNAARLRCPVVCFGFAVQVRTFLTRDSEPTPKPVDERQADGHTGGGGLYFHHPVMGATAVYAVDGSSTHSVGPGGGGRSLLAVAIREGDEDEEEDEEEVKREEERPAAVRRGSYSLASTSTSRRSSMEDASSHTSTASSSRTGE